ncbi:hypothetical protein ES703_98961 [subsurface metagenome]
MAALTRSFDSWTAASGKPTMVNEGKPGEISTSTSTIAPSSPTTAQLVTLASIIRLILYHRPVGVWNVVTTLEMEVALIKNSR